MYKTNLNYTERQTTAECNKMPVTKTITYYNDVESWSVNGAVKAFEKIVEDNDSDIELLTIETYQTS
tara:strand:- start:253 stop:453 length:201 start_codon:yes stop_codon:yes gene_type:complete